MGNGGTAGAGTGVNTLSVGPVNKTVKINSAGVGSSSSGKHFMSVPHHTNDRNNGLLSNQDLIGRKQGGQHQSLGVGGGVISPPDVMLPSPVGRLRELPKTTS